MTKGMKMVLIIVGVFFVGLIGFMIYSSTYGNPYWVLEQKHKQRENQILAENIIKQTEQETASQDTASSNQSHTLSEAERQELIQDKRTSFANGIIANMQGICTEAYFNSKGEFIVVVNSQWNTFSKEDKKDIIYLIESDLSSAKKNLEVEGLGQIFSTSGRGLETLYGK